MSLSMGRSSWTPVFHLGFKIINAVGYPDGGGRSSREGMQGLEFIVNQNANKTIMQNCFQF